MDVRGMMLGQRQRERELASDDRAGRFARGKARRTQRAYLWRNWKVFLTVGLGMLAPPLLTLPFLPSGFVRGLAVGVSATTVVALLSSWVVHATGTAPIMMGDQGEQWTAQALRKLRPRGWRLVNDISLKAWNIDHVIVGPGGAYAVETKWSAASWTVTPPDDRVSSGCRQVDDNARTMSNWLRPLGLGSVRPVLVLWGSNARDLPASQVLVAGDRSVTVVAGPHAKEWLTQLPTDQLNEAEVERAWERLNAQCRRRDDHDGDAAPVPLSLADLGSRAILIVLAASAALLVATTWLATSPSPWWWVPALVILAAPALAMMYIARSTRYLAWGWLSGVVVSVLSLAWVLARWFLERSF